MCFSSFLSALLSSIHPAFFLLLFRHMHAFKGAQPQCTSHPPMTLELLARIFFFPLVLLFSSLPLWSHPSPSHRPYAIISLYERAARGKGPLCAIVDFAGLLFYGFNLAMLHAHALPPTHPSIVHRDLHLFYPKGCRALWIAGFSSLGENP